jgi:hypothetical protein
VPVGKETSMLLLRCEDPEMLAPFTVVLAWHLLQSVAAFTCKVSPWLLAMVDPAGPLA